ncbi:hypothetical protein A3860_21800 [Niastella vici]|uniref:ZU5 domain-containing protein n=2 Tax=Niastella vici TaxID=1703345 RepID=A0A1V9G0A3_9BACT|nr:hypothetical protein A3860_21800 [Niastella vici]
MGTGCKKEKGDDEKAPIVQGLATPVGTSKGQGVTKQIGAAGGSITSADQKITISVPAGAVSGNTTIGIEPITNTNIAGIGTAYRLTPHGQHFDKPVSITFSWAAHADTIGLLQTLGLAYQMDNGIWKFVGSNSFDKGNQTVTFNTTHFSDWSLMNEVSLAPYHADLNPGEKQTIAALLFSSVDEDDDLFIPLKSTTGMYDEPGYPVGNPVPLPNEYVKQWHLNGPGSLATIRPTVVEYTAPGSANNYATAAVSLELKAPDEYPGQYLLVSNINIIGGSFVELSIGGATPVTFPATPVVKNGNQYMLANPQDEGGGYFLLTWIDGIGIHPFGLSTTGTYMHFITPQNSYTSMYRTRADAELTPSGGSVNVTKVSDGWAEGTFNATDAGYGPMLTSKTSLMGRFKVKLAQ